MLGRGGYERGKLIKMMGRVHAQQCTSSKQRDSDNNSNNNGKGHIGHKEAAHTGKRIQTAKCGCTRTGKWVSWTK